MCHIFRRDVLDHLLQLQNFQNQFLPNALRKLFCNISAPNNRGEYLSEMIDKFSDRFCHCNPKLGLDKGKDSMDIMIKWVFISYFVFFDLLWMKLVIDEGLILIPVRAGTHRVQIKSHVKGSVIHDSSFNITALSSLLVSLLFMQIFSTIMPSHVFSFILFLMFI